MAGIYTILQDLASNFEKERLLIVNKNKQTFRHLQFDQLPIMLQLFMLPTKLPCPEFQYFVFSFNQHFKSRKSSWSLEQSQSECKQ